MLLSRGGGGFVGGAGDDARPNGGLVEEPPVIPEPLTVLGLVAGIGGLGAYLAGRRRGVQS